MNRLFAEAYPDEDVSVLVAVMLRARGFRAVTTLEADRLGAGDEDQMRYAAAQQFTLVTHNRLDFEALHRRYLTEGLQHWGITIAARRPPNALVANLPRLLNHFTADEMRNQLRYI